MVEIWGIFFQISLKTIILPKFLQDQSLKWAKTFRRSGVMWENFHPTNLYSAIIEYTGYSIRIEIYFF